MKIEFYSSWSLEVIEVVDVFVQISVCWGSVVAMNRVVTCIHHGLRTFLNLLMYL